MGSPVDKIEVSAQTAELIRKRAEREGISVDAYLRALAEGVAAEPEAPVDVDEILNELAAEGKDLSPLPGDFSRVDVYSDSN